MTLPPDPIQRIRTYREALSAYEKLPAVRCCSTTAPARRRGLVRGVRAVVQSFFPIPGTVAHTWYLGAGGSLATSPDQTPEPGMFTWNPKALPATDYPASGSGLWGSAAGWRWTWQQNLAGTALSYVSQPLARPAARRSSRCPTCGRAVQPPPRGRFVEVTIRLYYEGHGYRAGSRIMVTISAPGGTRRGVRFRP